MKDTTSLIQDKFFFFQQDFENNLKHGTFSLSFNLSPTHLALIILICLHVPSHARFSLFLCHPPFLLQYVNPYIPWKPRLDYSSLSHSPRESCTSTSQHHHVILILFLSLFVSMIVSHWTKAPSENHLNEIYSAVANSCFSLEVRFHVSLRKPVVDHLTPLHLVHPFFLQHHFMVFPCLCKCLFRVCLCTRM